MGAAIRDASRKRGSPRSVTCRWWLGPVPRMYSALGVRAGDLEVGDADLQARDRDRKRKRQPADQQGQRERHAEENREDRMAGRHVRKEPYGKRQRGYLIQFAARDVTAKSGSPRLR